MTPQGKLSQLPSDLPEHTARGLAPPQRVGAIALDRLARRRTGVPGAQSGQRGRVGHVGWFGRVRHLRLSGEINRWKSTAARTVRCKSQNRSLASEYDGIDKIAYRYSSTDDTFVARGNRPFREIDTVEEKMFRYINVLRESRSAIFPMPKSLVALEISPLSVLL